MLVSVLWWSTCICPDSDTGNMYNFLTFDCPSLPKLVFTFAFPELLAVSSNWPLPHNTLSCVSTIAWTLSKQGVSCLWHGSLPVMYPSSIPRSHADQPRALGTKQVECTSLPTNCTNQLCLQAPFSWNMTSANYNKMDIPLFCWECVLFNSEEWPQIVTRTKHNYICKVYQSFHPIVIHTWAKLTSWLDVSWHKHTHILFCLQQVFADNPQAGNPNTNINFDYHSIPKVMSACVFPGLQVVC